MGTSFPTAKYFEGYIIIAGTEYDDTVIIKEDIGIESSPWWYSSVHEFICNINELNPGEIVKIFISVNIEEDDEGIETMNITELKREKLL